MQSALLSVFLLFSTVFPLHATDTLATAVPSDSLMPSIQSNPDSNHFTRFHTVSDSSSSGTSRLPSSNKNRTYPMNHASEIKATGKADTILDSSRILLQRDSLLAMENRRRDIYKPTRFDTDFNIIDEHAFFTADPTSWNDVIALKQWYVTPRIGIANSMNRLLYYGNTAPIDRLYLGSKLIYHNTADPFSALDASFVNEFSSITLSGSDGTLHFAPPTTTLISPECALFWENGVFGENIFSLRFSRPIAQNIIAHVFTNYRSFNGTQFDHDGNDVYTIFSNLTSDTTLLSHKGYNPLVNEFFSGATVSWKGTISRCDGTVTYGDLANEIALDREPVNNYLIHNQVRQFPLTLLAHYEADINPHTYLICEGKYVTNHQRITKGVYDPVAISTTGPFVNTTYTGAFRIGMLPVMDDSLDCTITSRYSKIGVPDSISVWSHNVRPELRWEHSFNYPYFSGTFLVQTGYDLHITSADTIHGIFWRANLSTLTTGFQMNFHIENDQQHLPPVYDTLSSDLFIHDTYLRTGVTISRQWEYISVKTGYQYYPHPDIDGIARTWINKTPPYLQPQSVFLVASKIGPFSGCALHSRIMISDTRPSIKLQAVLSYHILPEITHEAIDLRLGVDYWSRRDPVIFANSSDWNREILDINFASSVHIKSFRIFYKIDNVLNRNFSYIPGYYSPGITFRWGFNWFIQR